jgi:hypothetical protein
VLCRRGYKRAWELDHGDMSSWVSVPCAKCMLALYSLRPEITCAVAILQKQPHRFSPEKIGPPALVPIPTTLSPPRPILPATVPIPPATVPADPGGLLTPCDHHNDPPHPPLSSPGVEAGICSRTTNPNPDSGKVRFWVPWQRRRPRAVEMGPWSIHGGLHILGLRQASVFGSFFFTLGPLLTPASSGSGARHRP